CSRASRSVAVSTCMFGLLQLHGPVADQALAAVDLILPIPLVCDRQDGPPVRRSLTVGPPGGEDVRIIPITASGVDARCLPQDLVQRRSLHPLKEQRRGGEAWLATEEQWTLGRLESSGDVVQGG